MKRTLALLIILLLASFSTLSTHCHDFSPSEVFSLRIYSSKPAFSIPKPIIYNYTIYVTGGQGSDVIAVSTDGKVLWSQNAGGFIATPLLLVPDVSISSTKKEAWVIALTEAPELRALEAVNGGLRLYGVVLPSKSAGVQPVYAGDGRTVFLPLQSSIQAFDIRTRSELWLKNLTFRISFLKNLGDSLLVLGRDDLALLSSKGEILWERKLNQRIEAFGASSSYLAILLENKTLVLIDAKKGTHLSKIDLSNQLGYSVPQGEFQIVGGTAVLVGSSGVIYQIDLKKMEVKRSIRTWVEPVKQPIIIENALFYFGRGLVREYHFPLGIMLSEVRIEGGMGSDPYVFKDPRNKSYGIALFDYSGVLHLLRFPELTIKILDLKEESGGYLIEGYVCSTASSGSRELLKIYTLDKDANQIGEKVVGSIGPGECSARFSTFLPGGGALGLILGGFKFPPNAVIGMRAEDWISMKPGVTVTTTRPAVIPSLSFEYPESVIVGEKFKVRVRGINGWNVSKLTLKLTGSGIDEAVREISSSYGEEFEVELDSFARRVSEDARILLIGDGSVLRDEALLMRIERGKIIESVESPSSLNLNESLYLNLTLVNRYGEGEQFIARVELGNSSDEKVTMPLAAGGSQTLRFSIKPKVNGSLQLLISVLLSNGTKVDEYSKPVIVLKPPVTQTPQTTLITTTPAIPQVSVPQIRTEYLMAAALLLLSLAISLLIVRPKPPKRRIEVIAPMPEVPEVTGAPELEVPGVEEYPEIPLGWEEGVEAPEITEEVLPKEEIPPEEGVPGAPPVELIESIERGIRELNLKIEEIKSKLAGIEELLGFEISPYRLVDAESSLVTAELRLREGNYGEAERLVNSVKQSIRVLDEEIKEAEKVFGENWKAVENRIDIMLRVWGKAPAMMLTMVPPSFRIAALERFMRIHKEKKLELRGDELVLISD
jgi:outer membrane protein assembly factor BamB